ncbi:MAG: hypothetical protein M3N00_08550 [Actinomycetota bacterium]|nr:hypothetical protein [Actinomycetota bacterium]
MNKAAGQGTPVVSGSQVFAAGLASTGAAIVTSKFGVAGTILGAALTTMIITGGAMILKAYLESVAGKLRALRERRKAKRYAKPEMLPDRPDLRDNFMGNMRAAVGWFSYLPLPARRSILVKGLIAAAVAFVISMGAIYVVERGIGNSLSCGLWGTCPEGATPGIHLRGGGGGTSAGSTIGGGRVSQSGGIDRDGRVIGPDQQSSPLRQDPSYQPPTQRQTPSDPNVEPVDPNGEPAPVEPVEPEVPSEPVQPVPGQPTPQQQVPSEEVPSEEGAEVPSQQGVPPGAEPKPTPLQ